MLIKVMDELILLLDVFNVNIKYELMIDIYNIIKTKYKIEVNDNTSITIFGLFLLQYLFYTKYIKRTKYLLHT